MSKGLMTTICVMCIFLALISYVFGTSLTFESYLKRYNDLPSMPDIPDFQGDGVDILKDIYSLIIYPFSFSIWLGQVACTLLGFDFSRLIVGAGYGSESGGGYTDPNGGYNGGNGFGGGGSSSW